MSNRFRSTLVVCALLAAACSDSDVRGDEAAVVREGLTTLERVLGFEQVGTDWALAPGSGSATLTSANQHTEGSAAAQIANLGWAQVQSVRVGPVGAVSNTARFDILVAGSGAIPWGDVILSVDSPTAGLHHAQVGQKLLAGTSRGAFQAVTMPISSQLMTKLSSGSLSDLSVRLTVNLPGGSTVLLDKLSFGQAPSGSGGSGNAGAAGHVGSAGAGQGGVGHGGGGIGGTSSGGSGRAGGSGAAGTAGDAGTGATSGSGGVGGSAGAAGAAGENPDSEEFFIDIAANLEPKDVAFAAYGAGPGLVLNDGVKVVGPAGGFANVSSVRTTIGGTDLGVGTEVNDLYSQADVFVRGSHVYGDLTTAGALVPSPQLGSTFDGDTRQHTSIEPVRRVSWSVGFTPGAPDVFLDDNVTGTLAPGAHGNVTLDVGARLDIQEPGVYTVNGSLIMEPDSVLSVNNAEHQVEIYVRGQFIFRGAIQKQAQLPNVIIGVAGDGDVPIDRPFNAILVAPHGAVHLGTTAVGHRTSIYAESILARPNTITTHTPFVPDDLCGPGAPRGGLCASDCSTDADCATGLTCQSGVCGCAPNEGGACGVREPCSEAADCQQGLTCGTGAGARYGSPWVDVCLPNSCLKHGPESPDCGGPNALCGVCPPCQSGSCTPGFLYQLRAPDNVVAGAVEGQFAVSDSQTATYTIPLSLPPGRADMTPQVSLVYDSSGRQELLGEGWQLTGFSYLTRCLSPATPVGQGVHYGKRRGIRGEDDDQLCLDGQQLARKPQLDDAAGGTGYTTANDSFRRIRGYGGSGADAEYFVVSTPEGRKLTYGTPGSTDGTVLMDLRSQKRRVWALTRVEDQAGNYIEYRYGRNDGGLDNAGALDPDGVCDADPRKCGTSEIWPERILYTGFGSQAPTRAVEFHYDTETLREPVSGYLAGIQTTRTRLLTRIDASIDDEVVRSYLIENLLSSADVYEVRRIWECFPEHDDPEDDTSPMHDKCKSPTVFEYDTEAGFGPALDSGITLDPSPESTPESQFIVWDADGDGHDDLITAESDGISGGRWVQLSVRHKQDNSLEVTKTPLPYYQLNGARRVRFETGQDIRDIWREYEQSSIFDVNSDSLDDLMDTSARGHTHGEALKGGGDPGETVSSSESGDVLPPLTFPDAALYVSEGFKIPSMSFLDVDGDGLSDAVFFDSQSDILRWRRFVGGGLFREMESLAESAAFFYFPIDLDGDGALDFVTQPLGPDQTENGKIVNWDDKPSVPFFKMTRGHRDEYIGLIPPDILPIDINGDGLKDVLVRGPEPEVIFDTTKVTLYTNTGSGMVQSGTVSNMTHFEFESLNVLDYDSDGRDDALMWKGDRWVVLRGVEGELQEMELPEPLTEPGYFAFVRDTDLGVPQFESYVWSAVADVNGDGAGDLVVVDADKRVRFHLGKGATKHMLTVVTDGLGEQTQIQYSSGRPDYRAYVRGLFNEPERQEPTRVLSRVGRPLVQKEFSLRRVGDEYVFEHGAEYLASAARVDYAGRGWVGFDRRSIRNFNDGGTTEFTSLTYDRNRRMDGPPLCIDFDCEDLPGMDEEPYRYAYAGVPTSIDVQTPPVVAGLSVDEFRETRRLTEYDWLDTNDGRGANVTGRMSYLLLAKKTTTETELKSPGAVPRVISRIEETFDSDAAGNVTAHEVWTFNGENRVEHTTVSATYVPPDTDRWLLRLPLDVSVTRTRGTSVGPDAGDFTGEVVTRSVHYGHNELGQLTEVTRGGQGATTAFGRNEYGNVNRVERSGADVSSRVTVVDAFDDEDIYPRSITVQPDVAEQTEDDDVPLAPHTATYRYDARHGALTRVTDTNDLEENWAFDGFGRIVRHESPDGSAESYSYSESTADDSGPLPVAAVFKVTTEFEGGGETSQEIDSFGRPVRISSLSIGRVSEDGGIENATVVQELLYDESGRLHKQARPHLPGDTSQGVVTYNFNRVDELVSVVQPDGTGVTYDRVDVVSMIPDEVARVAPGPHDAFVLRRTDNYGAIETRVYDVTGQLTTSVAADGGRVSYVYDGFGALRFLNAPYGVTERVFDAVGRLISVRDPDRGFHEYTYTAFDEMLTHTSPGVNGDDARRVEHFDYDPFGRLTRIESADGVRRWEYDQAEYGVGRVSAEVVEAGGIAPRSNRSTYAYDEKGRIGAITHRVRGRDSVLAVGYTPDGRVQTLEYPGIGDVPFRVERVRDPASGLVHEVRDADDPGRRFWKLEETHQGYLPRVERIGGAVTTSRDYFDDTGLPMRIQSSVGNARFQDERYTFNLNHNLESRRNALVDESLQSFEYDELNRLHRVLDDGGSEVEKFEYDVAGTGNIIFKTGIGTYDYGDPGDPRPHAVKTTSGGRTFAYDDSGNQISRTGGSRGPQTLKYALFGLPYEIVTRAGGSSRLSEFEFSAGGQRIAKNRYLLSDPDDPDSERLPESFRVYLGELYELRGDCPGGQDFDCEEPALTHVYRVYGGGREVAQVHRDEGEDESVTGQRTYFLHDDQLGSTAVITAGDDLSGPSEGTVLKAQRYSPYGQADVETAGANDVSIGFAGHEEDSEEGLVNMRGRLFDPEIGRFLSPDPATPSADWTQGQNRYAYALNNPLNLIDPFGFQPVPGDGGAPGLGLDPSVPSTNPGAQPKVDPDNPATYTDSFRRGQRAHSKKGARDRNREQPSAGTTPSSAGGSATSGKPHPDAGQPGSPDGAKGSTPQPDSATTDTGSGRPGEGADEAKGNSGNKARAGSGTGSSTMDDITAVVSILNFQAPSQEGGISGGIPGGFCEGSRCVSGGGVQSVWVGLSMFGGKLASKATSVWHAVKAAGSAVRKVAEKAVDVATQRLSNAVAKGPIREGIYEFMEDGALYVGQSGDIPARLQHHVSTGRLADPSQAKVTEVLGGKTAREIAEHQRIQEITGGVPARFSDKVTNKKDPIGPNRRHLLP